MHEGALEEEPWLRADDALARQGKVLWVSVLALAGCWYLLKGTTMCLFSLSLSPLMVYSLDSTCNITLRAFCNSPSVSLQTATPLDGADEAAQREPLLPWRC